MFFSISTIGKPNIGKIVLKARRTILLFPINATEASLNEYLAKKYNIDLKHACIDLVFKATYHIRQNSVIITFKNKKDDKLASLITYGTGRIKGSNILKLAFGN